MDVALLMGQVAGSMEEINVFPCGLGMMEIFFAEKNGCTGSGPSLGLTFVLYCVLGDYMETTFSLVEKRQGRNQVYFNNETCQFNY